MRTLGAILILAGFIMVILRLFGLWGNPMVADGGLILALVVIGAGILFTRERVNT
jgi:tellurite resistance protein TehA-like permease